MKIYGYLVELLKKIKGPCHLKLSKDTWFEKTGDKEVGLSVETNYMDLFTPINSIESLDEGFLVNGNVSVNIIGKLEFRIKDLEPMMIESMIKDSIEFRIPCNGSEIQFGGGKMNVGIQETDLTGLEISIRAVSENFELKVGSSKLLLPWNSYIVIDKEQPDPVIVGTIDLVK